MGEGGRKGGQGGYWRCRQRLAAIIAASERSESQASGQELDQPKDNVAWQYCHCALTASTSRHPVRTSPQKRNMRRTHRTYRNVSPGRRRFPAALMNRRRRRQGRRTGMLFHVYHYTVTCHSTRGQVIRVFEPVCRSVCVRCVCGRRLLQSCTRAAAAHAQEQLRKVASVQVPAPSLSRSPGLRCRSLQRITAAGIYMWKQKCSFFNPSVLKAGSS